VPTQPARPAPPLELFRLAPSLIGRLPYVALGSYPTPIERLRALEHAAALPPRTEIWVKRDDLSGGCYRTSKVRKLEHVLACALAHDACRVVTVGPLGSNHALATALYARDLGLECVLQLWPEPLTPRIRQTLRAEHAAGARLELLGGADASALTALADAPPAVGSRTWFVPPAGTDAVGATGYVECGLEIAQQVREGVAPRPDALLVAGGTGGVAAGLAVGLQLAGSARRLGPEALPAAGRITAVRAVPRAVLNRGRLRLLARRIHRRLVELADEDLGPEPPPDAYQILEDQAGAGYGAPTEAAEEAARLFRDAEGLTLDLVYTAKAAAGVLAFARSAEGRGRRILFLHTYGEIDVETLSRTTPWDSLPTEFRALEHT